LNSANQPVVAIVNQVTSTSGEAYDSFIPSQVTGTIVLPLIMDHNSGWYTGFNVQNVGSAATDVTCTFTNTSYTVTGHLEAGAVLNAIQNGKVNGTNRYVGSGTCTATGSGAKIVAVVNEIAPGAGDGLLVYEGINQ